MWRLVILPLLVAVALVPGCRGGDGSGAGDGAAAGPPPPGEAEIARARQACEEQKKRACGAAEDGDGAPCREATARGEALDIQVRLLAAAGGISLAERRVAQAELRRIAARCIESHPFAAR